MWSILQKILTYGRFRNSSTVQDGGGVRAERPMVKKTDEDKVKNINKNREDWKLEMVSRAFFVVYSD